MGTRTQTMVSATGVLSVTDVTTHDVGSVSATGIYSVTTRAAPDVDRTSVVGGILAASTEGGGVAPGPTTDPNVTAINAEGWSVTYTSPPTFDPVANPKYVVVGHQGFDATGAAATVTRNRILTRRKRQLYPNQLSDTANDVAMNEYVYAGDTVTGKTNNSAIVSPKPVGRFVGIDRRVVGNTISGVEIDASHRDASGAKQIACVKFLISDGVTTISVPVSTPTISTAASPLDGGWDKQPLPVYVLPSTDITALTAGLITVNAELYPLLGVTASVNKSADNGTDRKDFTARYFLKNVSKASSPPIAYVSTTGNDTTGVWSTTAATAEAAPFATLNGAMNIINDATRGTPATGGIADGCKARLMAGTHTVANVTTNRTQNVAGFIVERDPNTTKAAAILSFANAAWRPKLATGFTSPLTEGCIHFREITMTRTGSVGSIAGETTGSVTLDARIENVALDFATFTTAFFSTTAASAVHQSHFGTTITNNGSSAGGLNATVSDIRMIRGVTVTVTTQMVGWAIYSSIITGAAGLVFQDATKGGVIKHNKYPAPSAVNAVANIVTALDADTITGFVFDNNLIESIHTTSSTAALGYAQNKGNTAHCMMRGNTVLGYSGLGRANMFYAGFASLVNQVHDLMSVKGNILPQLNFKGDVWMVSSTYSGGLAFDHGVGCAANIMLYNTATPAGENQTYPGLGSVVGSSNTSPVATMASLFANYQATTGSGGTPSAGAGGGTYTLPVGSLAIGVLADAVLSHDFAGNARPAANDAAGAYKAA